jgi:hypothetical protein
MWHPHSVVCGQSKRSGKLETPLVKTHRKTERGNSLPLSGNSDGTLEKDGWTITDDPLVLVLEQTLLKADLLPFRYKIRQSGERELRIERKPFRRSPRTLTSGRNCTIGITNSQYWTLIDFGRSALRSSASLSQKSNHS